MANYNEYKEQLLKDPEFKAEYDALQSEYDKVNAMIETRSLKMSETEK